MARTKTVTLDDVSFKIAALSFKEAEELFPTSAPQRTADEQIAFMGDLICRSLNKVNGDEWTPEKLKAELDIPLYLWLYNQILELCGIKPASPGEAKAAS
jgi:hypothetical protein